MDNKLDDEERFDELVTDLVNFEYNFDTYEFKDQYETLENAYEDFSLALKNNPDVVLSNLKEAKEDFLDEEDYETNALLETLITRVELYCNDTKLEDNEMDMQKIEKIYDVDVKVECENKDFSYIRHDSFIDKQTLSKNEIFKNFYENSTEGLTEEDMERCPHCGGYMFETEIVNLEVLNDDKEKESEMEM